MTGAKRTFPCSVLLRLRPCLRAYVEIRSEVYTYSLPTHSLLPSLEPAPPVRSLVNRTSPSPFPLPFHPSPYHPRTPPSLPIRPPKPNHAPPLRDVLPVRRIKSIISISKQGLISLFPPRVPSGFFGAKATRWLSSSSQGLHHCRQTALDMLHRFRS